MRCRAVSRPMTFTSTFWPGAKLFGDGVPGGTPVSEFGMRPVSPGSRRTKTPNGATFSTSPVTTEPSAMALLDALPRIGRGDLAQRERQPAVLRVDFLHPALHRLADGDGGSLSATPGGSCRDVDEAVDARLDLDEEAEVGVAATVPVNEAPGAKRCGERSPTDRPRAPSWKARCACPRCASFVTLTVDFLADGEDVLRRARRGGARSP